MVVPRPAEERRDATATRSPRRRRSPGGHQAVSKDRYRRQTFLSKPRRRPRQPRAAARRRTREGILWICRLALTLFQHLYDLDVSFLPRSPYFSSKGAVSAVTTFLYAPLILTLHSSSGCNSMVPVRNRPGLPETVWSTDIEISRPRTTSRRLPASSSKPSLIRVSARCEVGSMTKSS